MPDAELEIRPLERPPDRDVRLPGSKSLTNRALVAAALASGRSTLRGALRADDTEAMVGCLRSLGLPVADGWPDVTVDGGGGRIPDGPATLDARQSGTTARFVAPLLALGRGDYVLTGDEQLARRPMGPVLDAIAELGAEVVPGGRAGQLPVTIRAPGALRGGRVRLPGDTSSQFLSGLLLAAPAMVDGLVVELTTELVSRPYVEMTAGVMAAFGVPVDRGAGGSTFTVAPGAYRATEYAVEPDASAASYFFAAAAVTPGSRVRVVGLGRGSTQGDLAFVDLLRRMGAGVEVGSDATEVHGPPALRGITADLRDLSDTAPTLAVVAALASGPTRIEGIGFIRGKESDRVTAVVTELRRCGVDAVAEPDGIEIRPPAGGPRGARIETYGDHRIAMSFAVLGLRVPGVVVLDPGCVAKTFPGFFEALDALR